ncbi:AraC family transcriptional regulator [Corallococcus praedator]|uniref:AraC family transcriptional regulator n=1 Tax=Corallococcus praedator TaxID=2316724 RepID=A0ABX9QEW6_9BACT|nr:MULTISPECIES: AraC family transcriptional regulator [Corallococcus]RKH25209.1 AraC family transcriptional regulator [Corallococcus sp. CA031C]RKI02418.1 AraC family transcriptional regulator [Corallococcus praedator]
MKRRAPDDLGIVDRVWARLLASGEGWRVSEVVCRSGPRDPVFEEEHAWVSVSAVLEGSFTYRSKRGRVLLTPGSLLLGEPKASFCCGHEHGVGDRCVAFHLAPALLEEVAGDLSGVTRTGFASHRLPPLQRLAPLIADVQALAASPGARSAEELVLRMAGAALRGVEAGTPRSVSTRDERRMAEAVRTMEARLVEPLSLGTLAEGLGMGRHHFLRTFRKVIGESPYSYVLGRRLGLAAERLRTSHDRIADIAFACGFGDLSEFVRRFGARFGVTPSAYRAGARLGPA